MTLDASLPAETHDLVLDAVGPQGRFNPRALQDRLFAQLFTGLVYAQIWEDPDVDMAGMELKPGHHVVAIASGGCNALSYLTAGAGQVTAVDLNAAHVALVKLKIAGVKHLPDWHSFYRFFGAADDAANVADYRHYLEPQLDPATAAYWNSKGRIKGFSRNIYKTGLLGRCIALAHAVARLHGVRVGGIFACQTLAEQRAYFESELAPLFRKPWIRAALRSPMALFGLGIPPAQYAALSGGRQMDEVLSERLEKLTCDFPIAENYFAWQAFGRAYAPDGEGSLPPYLQQKNFKLLREAVDRISVRQDNIVTVLRRQKQGSVDRVSLLDAQDWMTTDQRRELWQAVTVAAAPGARVIFRTAGPETLEPKGLNPGLLSKWVYLDQQSAALHAKDRSSIYGGFHIYELRR